MSMEITLTFALENMTMTATKHAELLARLTRLDDTLQEVLVWASDERQEIAQLVEKLRNVPVEGPAYHPAFALVQASRNNVTPPAQAPQTVTSKPQEPVSKPAQTTPESKPEPTPTPDASTQISQGEAVVKEYRYKTDKGKFITISKRNKPLAVGTALFSSKKTKGTPIQVGVIGGASASKPIASEPTKAPQEVSSTQLRSVADGASEKTTSTPTTTQHEETVAKVATKPVIVDQDGDSHILNDGQFGCLCSNLSPKGSGVINPYAANYGKIMLVLRRFGQGSKFTLVAPGWKQKVCFFISKEGIRWSRLPADSKEVATWMANAKQAA